MTTETHTLFGLQWPAPAAREIRINVIMMHGDAYETFSESRLTFTDDPEGHERAQFAMKALPYINAAAGYRRSKAMSGYEICVAAAAAMSVPAATLAPLFKSMFCQDARYPMMYLALPVAYTLEHHTEAGIQRAVFPYGKGKQRHFKLITQGCIFDVKGLHYLKPWA
jgi:hypothetical protein